MIPFELVMSIFFGLMAGVTYYAVLVGAQRWKTTTTMLTFMLLNSVTSTAAAAYAAQYVLAAHSWLVFLIPIVAAAAGFILFAVYQYSKPANPHRTR